MIFKKLIPFILVTFFCIGSPGSAAADDIDGWELINSQLNDMTYGDGVYVAVGENGFILRSTDGETWTKVDSGVDEELGAVVYGEDRFVVIGGRTILTSPDGTAWTLQDPAVDVYAYDLTYGEELFAASGGSKVYLSPDGVDWTEHETGATHTQSGITYGNGLFVVIGYGGMILTSENGSSGWTSRTSPVSPTFWDITYTGSEFVAVGTSGNVVTSADGISWATTSNGVTGTMMAVGYGDGRFVTTGSNNSSDTGHIWTSMDAETWTDNGAGIYEFMYDVEYIGKKFYITGGKIIASDDGVDWTTVRDTTGWSLQSLAYGDGVYVAGLQFGVGLKSVDGGTTWTSMTSSHDSDIAGIAYNPDLGLFIGVCASGQVLSASPANDYWVSTVHSLGTGLKDIEFDPETGNNLIVGYSGTIATINSSGVLSTVPPLTSYTLSGVAIAGSTYVAVGDNGTVITSLDSGANWQTVTAATSETLLDVQYGNGIWMAGGYFGALITSPDGINWTDASGSFSHVYGITYGNGIFVAHGGGGTLMSSRDGMVWEDYNVVNSYLPAGVFAEDRFTIAGGDGTILQSAPIESSGGGGGGGCNTSGSVTGTPLRGDLIWIMMLGVYFFFYRRKVNGNASNSRK